jgi:hypothetical protein
MYMRKARPWFSRYGGYIIFALLISLLFITSGCGHSQARLRVVNALLNSSSLDIVVNSKTLASNIAYSTASKYVFVNAGSSSVQINLAGTSTNVLSSTPALATRTDTTVIVAGRSNANVNSLVLLDDNSMPPVGEMKLRIVNAAPDLGTVDVYVTSANTDITALGPTIAALGYGTASTYIVLGGGSYQIQMTATGTKSVLVNTGTITLNNGDVNTAVALNPTSGSSRFGAILLTDAPPYQVIY